MRRSKAIWALFVLATCAACLTSASVASAALPEIGRCAKVTPTVEGKKKTYKGKFTNHSCTRESKNGNGKFEWTPGAGEGKEFESPGTLEPVTLETAAGTQIACENSKSDGETTGANSEKLSLSLYECKDLATSEPCQSLRPEETPPTAEEGTILSQALDGELGFIKKKGKGGKPEVGWDYKPASGSKLFEFECGAVSSPGLGTKVSIEGSFISQVHKFIDKMTEEYFLRDQQKAGHQVPEMFEGAAKDTLTATFVTPSLQMTTEQLGYSSEAEEQSMTEALEIKAIA